MLILKTLANINIFLKNFSLNFLFSSINNIDVLIEITQKFVFKKFLKDKRGLLKM